MEKHLKEKLGSFNSDKLREICRKFDIKSYSKLNKVNLITVILKEVDEKKLHKFLFPSLWDSYKNSIFGWASLIGLPIGIAALCIACYQIKYQDTNKTKNESDKFAKDILSCRFAESDTLDSNILILKTIKNEKTDIIETSLQKELSQIITLNLLDIKTKYCDDFEVKFDDSGMLNKEHNADLIFYINSNSIKYSDIDGNLSGVIPIENVSIELYQKELLFDGKKLEVWLMPLAAKKDSVLKEAIIDNAKMMRKESLDSNRIGLYEWLSIITRNNSGAKDDSDKSVRYSFELLKIDSTNVTAQSNLIKHYQNTKQLEKEIKQRTILIDVKTNYYDDRKCISRQDYLYLADAQKRFGDCHIAIKNYEKVLRENWRFIPTFSNQQCCDVISMLRNVHNKEKPKDQEAGKAHLGMGECYAKLGIRSKSKSELEKAVENDYRLGDEVEKLMKFYRL